MVHPVLQLSYSVNKYLKIIVGTAIVTNKLVTHFGSIMNHPHARVNVLGNGTPHLKPSLIELCILCLPVCLFYE